MATIGSEDGDIGFQIAPMVDVVFVLMLFFMASAATQLTPKELTSSLPGPSGETTEAPIGFAHIDVLENDRVLFNGQQMDGLTSHELPQLSDRLAAMMEFGGDDVVIIRPEAGARHQRVVDVMNAAAKANVSNLTFQ